MRVFSVFACIAFSLAALIIFCALPLSASASVNLGPQPKVAVLPSPDPKVLVLHPPVADSEWRGGIKLRQPVADKDVPALTVEADKGDPVARPTWASFL